MVRFVFILSTIILFCLSAFCQSAGTLSSKEKPSGVGFSVNNVEIAPKLLNTNEAKKVFENKIGKTILFIPQRYAGYGVVQCANNGLIQTIQECYDNHRPLVLTPDHIWLAICQGVSIHINENYESLKDVIFIKDKPNQLIIQNDSLEYAAKHWENLISSFSAETGKYTKQDFYSFYVSQFSTTSPIERTAYQITLLESYKKAFEYIGETGCGIPSIHVAGSKQDWQLILKKLDLLNNIGLNKWVANLKPIIEEFLAASEGKANTDFWKDIYKNADEYAATYVSGWIIKLFPYIKVFEYGEYDEKHEGTKTSEIFKPNTYLDGNSYMMSTLSTDNFPSGIAKIDVIWNNYFKGEKKKIEIYAGFMAMKQYEDKSLEPLISWAICEKDAEIANNILVVNTRSDVKHDPDFWFPQFSNAISDSAVYDIKRFKTYAKSSAFIRQLVWDSLNINADFKNRYFKGDTLKIEVYYNGSIGHVGLIGKESDTEINNYLNQLIKQLPEKWFPAMGKMELNQSIFIGIDILDNENDKKIRVHSIVKIRL